MSEHGYAKTHDCWRAQYDCIAASQLHRDPEALMAIAPLLRRCGCEHHRSRCIARDKEAGKQNMSGPAQTGILGRRSEQSGVGIERQAIAQCPSQSRGMDQPGAFSEQGDEKIEQ